MYAPWDISGILGEVRKIRTRVVEKKRVRKFNVVMVIHATDKNPVLEYKDRSTLELFGAAFLSSNTSTSIFPWLP